MVPAGNKAKGLSLVNHTIKTIHHHQFIIVILDHFLPFYLPNNQKNQNFEEMEQVWRYHFTHLYHEWQSYDVWFLRYEVWWPEFFVILDCFLPFYLPNNPKTQNFEKLKKTPGDIIILHVYHKWQSNDYGSWNIECDRQILFWTIFCPFTPLTTQNIKILKKLKKCLEILSFYIGVPKIRIISYTVLEI